MPGSSSPNRRADAVFAAVRAATRHNRAPGIVTVGESDREHAAQTARTPQICRGVNRRSRD